MNLRNSSFEWVCKRCESTSQKILRIFSQWGCIVFGILSMFFMLYIPFVIPTAIFAVVWIILFRGKKVEYEFDYFSGDLGIFKITNGLRRKKKFVCTLDDIAYLRKGTDEHTPTKKFYFNPDAVYTMQVNTSKGLDTLLIETDERFVQILDQERKLRK